MPISGWLMIGWLHVGVGPKLVTTSMPSIRKNRPDSCTTLPVWDSTRQPSRLEIGTRWTSKLLAAPRAANQSKNSSVVPTPAGASAERKKVISRHLCRFALLTGFVAAPLAGEGRPSGCLGR